MYHTTSASHHSVRWLASPQSPAVCQSAATVSFVVVATNYSISAWPSTLNATVCSSDYPQSILVNVTVAGVGMSVANLGMAPSFCSQTNQGSDANSDPLVATFMCSVPWYPTLGQNNYWAWSSPSNIQGWGDTHKTVLRFTAVKDGER